MLNGKYGKIWGNTQEIFQLNNISINRIEINQGASCSKHYHEHKYNMFYIESGTLKIDVWQKDYDLIDSTIISNGESSIVKPKLFHRFIALEDTIAYEIYYTLLEDNDITREDCGSA